MKAIFSCLLLAIAAFVLSLVAGIGADSDAWWSFPVYLWGFVGSIVCILAAAITGARVLRWQTRKGR